MGELSQQQTFNRTTLTSWTVWTFDSNSGTRTESRPKISSDHACRALSGLVRFWPGPSIHDGLSILLVKLTKLFFWHQVQRKKYL